MPTEVNLKPETRILVSGHPATLKSVADVEFDLPSGQAVAESLANDPENLRLNIHLLTPVEPKVSDGLFLTEDDQVAAVGYKLPEMIPDEEVTIGDYREVSEPKPAKKKAVKKAVKKTGIKITKGSLVLKAAKKVSRKK